MDRQNRDFTVLGVGPLQHAFKGDYLECATDIGTVAIWGSARNTNNINAVQRAETPFRVRALCINPNANYPQHDLWVPEKSPIKFIPGPELPDDQNPIAGPKEAAISVEELAKWRRCIIRIVNQMDTGLSFEETLSARIRRLAREGYIPRDIIALMFAITESRNLAEYESKLPIGPHCKALINAWEAILQWAETKGIDPGH
jgi:hypothetical protein